MFFLKRLAKLLIYLTSDIVGIRLYTRIDNFKLIGMHYKIYSFVILLFLLASCSQSAKSNEGDEEGILLTGKVKKPQPQGHIVLEEITENSTKVVDTLNLLSDSTFSLEVMSTEPGFYRLNFYDKQYVTLVLNTEDDVHVQVDGSAQAGLVEVTGSVDTDYMNKVNTIIQQFQKDVNALNNQYIKAKNNGDEQEVAAVEQKFLAIQAVNSAAVKNEIRKMDGSIASIYATNYLNPEEEFVFLDSLAQMLEKEIPHSSHVQKFVTQINAQKSLAVGQKAPEISLPNPDGEIIKLSSLRGQYVLVDFWAEWCGPCRKENPNVVKVYKKYHDKGFEIFGVSLDRDKDKWLKAIKQDNLTWVHVSDLKYWNSEVVPLYSITGIPFTVLLDREGNIIAKNLRGKALEDKLAEIFKES